jgi:hypothetical protein
MKYETPEMTMLTPAINAIQSPPQFKPGTVLMDGSDEFEINHAYEDWE